MPKITTAHSNSKSEGSADRTDGRDLATTPKADAATGEAEDKSKSSNAPSKGVASPGGAQEKSKSTKEGSKVGGSRGVAHLAARATRLLSNSQFFLCLAAGMQRDVVQLIKDAGGTITGRLAPPHNNQPLVVLCGDTDHNVSGAVHKAVTKNPESYRVVHCR